jgi:hypothetical protein
MGHKHIKFFVDIIKHDTGWAELPPGHQFYNDRYRGIRCSYRIGNRKCKLSSRFIKWNVETQQWESPYCLIHYRKVVEDGGGVREGVRSHDPGGPGRDQRDGATGEAGGGVARGVPD